MFVALGGEWRRGRLYFSNLRVPIGISLACSVLKGGLAVLFALSLRGVLDGLGEGGRPENGARLVALLLALAMALMGFATRFAVAAATQTLLERIRLDLVRKILLLSPEDVGRYGRAKIQSLILRDTDLIDRMANSMMAYAIPAVISLAALGGLLLVLSPLLGAGTMAIGGLLWLATRVHKNAIERNAAVFTRQFSILNRGILLTLERLALIRSGGLETLELAQRGADISELGRIGTLTDRSIGMISETLALLGNIAVVILLGGGALLAAGIVPLAQLLTVYLILLLMRAQTSTIGSALPDVRLGMSSLRRLVEFLELPTETPYSGKRSCSFRGNLRLSKVAFSHDTAPLLQGVDLELTPGTCTLITGANGSGKTTLIQLILGTLKPQTGQISAEDVPYPELDLALLREATSFLTQEPIIFDGSIAENICYGRPHAGQRDLERAARLAGAEAFIKAHVDGYNRAVGDNGVLLSGGERQRVALARALLGRPQLLIMDEPTNHLDAEAVAGLLPALRSQDHAPAILIVSHDRSLIAGADQVFELEGGVLKRFAGHGPAVVNLQDLRREH